MAAEPNRQLVKELRDALALAEQGKIRDGIIVAIGDEVAHHGFAVERGPHRLVSLLGELDLCKSGLQNALITERMEQSKAAAAGVVGGRLRN